MENEQERYIMLNESRYNELILAEKAIKENLIYIDTPDKGHFENFLMTETEAIKNIADRIEFSKNDKALYDYNIKDYRKQIKELNVDINYKVLCMKQSVNFLSKMSFYSRLKFMFNSKRTIAKVMTALEINNTNAYE